MGFTTISEPGAVGAAPAPANNPMEVADMTDRTCSFEGCTNQHHAKGWCGSHYQRWYRHGDPSLGGPEISKFPANLLDRYEVTPSGCWVFTGYIEPNGYGRLAVNGHNEWAHRASYAYHVGPIPSGLELDHLCRNRRCVNPAHLEPVPPAVNGARGFSPPAVNARKTHCVNGHEFTEENTYVYPDTGWRMCRACKKDARARWYAVRLVKDDPEIGMGGK